MGLQVCLISYSLHKIISQKEAGKLAQTQNPNQKFQTTLFFTSVPASLSLQTKPCCTTLHRKHKIRIWIHGWVRIRTWSRRKIMASLCTPSPNWPRSISFTPRRRVPIIRRLARICLLHQFSPWFTTICHRQRTRHALC